MYFSTDTHTFKQRERNPCIFTHSLSHTHTPKVVGSAYRPGPGPRSLAAMRGRTGAFEVVVFDGLSDMVDVAIRKEASNDKQAKDGEQRGRECQCGPWQPHPRIA